MKKFLFMLALGSASSHAIDVYRAQEIQPYQPSRGGDAPAPTPAYGSPQAGDAYGRPPAQPYEQYSQPPAQAADPYGRPPMPQQYQEQRLQQQAVERAAPQSRQPQQASGAVGALLGVWQTNIPGAVYTTPSGRPGYDIQVVSSGAAAGLLRLNRDGTYGWNSYGGKKGRWVETGQSDYPLQIIDIVENKRWKVGWDPRTQTLTIWDGQVWYNGRKAGVR
jgi:hypothetical protein